MAVFQTYQAIGNKEDLLDLITNITPTDTPMFSSLAKSKAKATLHEWLTDSLASAAANAEIEGSDAAFGTLTPRVRTGNYAQILRKTFQVSDTQDIVDKAGLEKEYAYQMEKAMKELARDIEYALVNGTGNVGASATARTLKGVLAWITTNVETGTGTADEALTETMYNNMLQTIYAAGGNPDTTYANAWQKRKIDAFTAGATKYVEAADQRLVAAVGVYESSFGVQKIVLDRYMTTSVVACLQNDKWRVAPLRAVKHTPIAKIGSSERGMIEAELTLESLNEAASGKITGLTTS